MDHPFWLTSLPLCGWKVIICWGLAPATKYDTHDDRLVCWPDSIELWECHCFDPHAAKLHRKGQQRGVGDCLHSLFLMQRTHKDGGASCSPLLIPCNQGLMPGGNKQEPSSSWNRKAGEEKGCVNQAQQRDGPQEPGGRAGHHSCCTLNLRDHYSID